MAHVGRDVVGGPGVAHEAQDRPVGVVEPDAFLRRQLAGDLFVPVRRVDQVALGIARDLEISNRVVHVQSPWIGSGCVCPEY